MVNVGTYVEIKEDTFNYLQELLSELNFIIGYGTSNDIIEDFTGALTDFLDNVQIV